MERLAWIVAADRIVGGEEWRAGLVVEYLETEPEAEIAEFLEFALHRYQRLVWIDSDGHGVELTGIAFKFRRKRAHLFSDLVLAAKFCFHHKCIAISCCRNTDAHDRLHTQDVE